MPITYQIDRERGLLRTRCEGNTTFFEVMDHFRALENDPDCPDRLDVLLDLSTMTSLPTSEQLRLVSDELHRVRSRIRFDVCAIVARSDAAFGMARVFEVLAEARFGATQVFRNQEEAEGWLTAQQTAS